MDCVQIPCPKCGAELRLQDRALLGRRGRCPSCAHRFILREPEDVPLELAKPIPQLPVGTSAQWVPDDPSTPNGSPPPSAPADEVYFQPAPEDAGFVSSSGATNPPCPVAQSEHAGAIPGADPPNSPQSFAVMADPPPTPSRVPSFPQAPNAPQQPAGPAAGGPILSTQTVAPPVTEVVAPNKPSSGVDRLQQLRRRKTKQRRMGLVIGGIVAAILAGVLLYAKSLQSEPNGNRAQPPPAETQSERQDGQADEAQPERVEEMPTTTVSSPQPIGGAPLDLRWMPVGPRVIVHLRTGELWGDERRMQELRACLGPFGQWVEERLQQVCLFSPAELEHATICFVLGPRGAAPDVAAVVRLKTLKQRSELIQTLRGTRMDDLGYPYYVVGQTLTGQRAYLIDNDDPQRIAVGPEHLVKEMIEHQNTPAVTATGIEQLLGHTDADRHFTVVFEPNDLRLHMEAFTAENAHTPWQTFLGFFGENVETVAWSLHMGDALFSELQLRPDRVVRPAVLQQEFESRLQKLPTEMLAAVEMMHPTTAGGRQLIGRFPAMIGAVRLGTRVTVDGETVRLTTSLAGDRPAPNLLLAGRLTWDESTRTDFSTQKPTTQPAGPKPAGTIADRLKKPIDVDFNRTPLQEAIDYIGEETAVRFEIDGDALKLSGYTKNMAQTFKLGMVPATQGLAAILKQYDQMVIVVDEQQQVATVMTKAVAAEKGLQPFPLTP